MNKKISIITLLIISGILTAKSLATDSDNLIMQEQEKIQIEEMNLPTISDTSMEMKVITEPSIKTEIPKTVLTLEQIEIKNPEEVETKTQMEMELTDAEINENFYTSKDDTEKLTEEELKNITILDAEIKEVITNEEVEKVLERLIENGKINKIEDLRLSDIIGNEEVSEELKFKIKEIISIAQNELDSYRTAMKNNYKTMTRRLLEVKRELNRVQDFKDEAEYDLEVSRWMILTLSMGVICLTFLIVIMWRSVSNIGKNEIEVLFAYEDLKKNLGNLAEQIDLLHKKNTIAKEETIEEI